VPALTDVIAIAAGNEFSLALKSDGTVWAWGRNWERQLGVETTSTCHCSVDPVQVMGLASNVVEIGAGHRHGVAIAEVPVP
jgi:alpha-tubulin suppressor-like RCC1 family protein